MRSLPSALLQISGGVAELITARYQAASDLSSFTTIFATLIWICRIRFGAGQFQITSVQQYKYCRVNAPAAGRGIFRGPFA
jgi:hypothetical protein